MTSARSGFPTGCSSKPGKLDDEERAAIERHAEIGYRMLRGAGSDLLDLAASIALTHHERFDGAGYPQGLRGEEIPLEGRIAAVADVFDALTTDRVYRPAFPFDEAIGMLLEGRGRNSTPRCSTRSSRCSPQQASPGGRSGGGTATM